MLVIKNAFRINWGGGLLFLLFFNTQLYKMAENEGRKCFIYCYMASDIW